MVGCQVVAQIGHKCADRHEAVEEAQSARPVLHAVLHANRQQLRLAFFTPLIERIER